MQRRGVSRQPPKGQRPTKPKARKVRTARASIADRDELLDQRTRERDEAREQLAATSGVLRVISRSAFDLQTVFDTLVESAARLCRANYAAIRLGRDGFFHQVASYGYTPEQHQYMNEHPIPAKPDRGSIVGRVLSAGKTTQIVDTKADPEFRMTNIPGFENVHTHLGVPLLREGKPIGVLVLMRGFVGAFTDKQIELVETFAAQAVIAIENTRLLNELRHRTDDLSESLERQTATAEILSSISNSMTETKPVFDAIVRNLLRLFSPRFATVQVLREGIVEMPAAGGQPGFEKITERYPRPLDDTTVSGQAMLSKEVVQYSPVIGNRIIPATSEQIARDVGYDSIIAAPMLLGDKVIGTIVVAHHEPRVFDEKRVALIKSFADQAVIAIENARLFSELRQRTDDLSESLQQQTATADVLKVISRSTFDLRTVLQTLVESAAKLCNAPMASITRPRGNSFYLVASYGFPPDFDKYMHTIAHDAGRDTLVGRTLLEAKVTQIDDVQTDPEYVLHEGQKIAGFRTVLGVPLLRDGATIAVMVLARTVVQPFSDKEIKLASTFADQAAIAIENVRLFESVEARTRELAKSLDDLRNTQDRLVQTQKLALLGQLTAGIAHEIKNPLNFVNNFSGISAELIDELRDTLKGIPLDDKTRAEIEELADTLKGNFDKVVHHGRRADAIVKNMLQHSREGSGEHRVIDINALVEESLNLAWHGARAETQGFEIKLKLSVGQTFSRRTSGVLFLI